MKLLKSIFVFFFLSFLGLALGGDYLEIPVVEYYGGSLWTEPKILRIDSQIRLNQESVIQTDQLVIAAPVVTNGNRLRINVRKLVFEGTGKIIAFDSPAEPAVENILKGAQGGTGESFDHNDHKGSERDGGQGGVGSEGPEGAPGPNGHQNPGEILIYAGEIAGAPVIDGTGQRGGTGGKGGQGGRGGTGGNGAQANVPLIGTKKRAGNGGAGGFGGSGGKGGRGGQGGTAVRVTLLVGTGAESTSFSNITSAPGSGGLPGEPGSRGPDGDPGSPGRGDSSMFNIRKNGDGGVNPQFGDRPAENAGTAGPGPMGAAQALQGHFQNQDKNVSIVNLSELGKRRTEVYSAWYEFHWTRSFNFLIRDSIRLASFQAVSRAEIEKEMKPFDGILRLQQKHAEKIRKAWRNHFINPLKEIKDPTILTKNKDYFLEIALETVDLIQDGLRAEKLSQKLRQVDQLMKQSLTTAILTCSTYNSIKVNEISSYLGTTHHYEIPVCSDPKFFSKTENIGKAIQLTRKIPSEVFPKGLIRTETSFHLFKLPFETPSAWAEDFKIEWVADESKIIEQSKAVTLLSEGTIEPHGVLMGLLAPEESRVNMNTLGQYLHVLSLQLGAKQ